MIPDGGVPGADALRALLGLQDQLDAVERTVLPVYLLACEVGDPDWIGRLGVLAHRARLIDAPPDGMPPGLNAFTLKTVALRKRKSVSVLPS